MVDGVDDGVSIEVDRKPEFRTAVCVVSLQRNHEEEAVLLAEMVGCSIGNQETMCVPSSSVGACENGCVQKHK